jgi:hypothetical protein
MSKFTYKDITLEIVERSITIGGYHKIILKAQNDSLVNLISKKSIRINQIEKNIEDNYKQVKRLIA